MVQAFLAKHYTGVTGSDLRRPIGTVTAVDHHSLVTSHMIKLRGDNVGSHPDDPLHTISAGGFHHGQVQAFLMKYYGQGGQWQDVRDPVHTLPTKARMGLVMVKGQPYQLVDIGMRMLQPHELYQAQGFPPDYIIDRTWDGRRLTKAEQNRMCGNSVSPYPVEAMVTANYQPNVAAAAA
jgi:DNA (cytosine-5)-methyltransferase 1